MTADQDAVARARFILREPEAYDAVIGALESHSGRTPLTLILAAATAAARREGRRAALEEAAKCVCAYCRDGWERLEDGRHFHDNGRLIGTCSDEATRILAIAQQEPDHGR